MSKDRSLEALRDRFLDLQREHEALMENAQDRAAHEEHRQHLRDYVDALHEWRARYKLPAKPGNEEPGS